MTRREQIRAIAGDRLKCIQQEMEDPEAMRGIEWLDTRKALDDRRSERIPALKKPLPDADPAKERAGYVELPHGLLGDPRFKLLSAFQVRLLLHALSHAVFPDKDDLKEFGREESVVSKACQKQVRKRLVEEKHWDPDAAEKESETKATTAFRRRHYLLDGRWMTRDYIEECLGGHSYDTVVGAFKHLMQLGLLRMRWAVVHRHRGKYTNEVRFFIVYDNIDPERCKHPAPVDLWDKLARISKKNREYWQGWYLDESLVSPG